MFNVNTLKAHLAINVRDVEKSIDFYRAMLGIEPSKVRTGYAKFDVANPPLNLTLNQIPFTDSGALSHLGIQVASTEDVNAIRNTWQERGLIPRDEMQTKCCYALQDKAWVNDPDGNEWEVFTVIEDNLGENVEGAADKSCCVTPAASEPISIEVKAPAHSVKCGCESTAPSEEGACCETQAKAFNVEVKADAGSCCA